MKSFGLYINSHCDYDAGFPQWSPFIRYPYDQKNEERSPWSTETAESTIHSLSGLNTSVSLLTQAPLVDYLNLPRLALVRDTPTIRWIDEKFATDRWPLNLKTHLIRTLFGKSIYEVLFLRSVRGVVFFRVGQPLGFLYSWPLFTLTHHLVMFYCAEKVYPGQRFTKEPS
ncbi:hypothetical protein JHK82_048035 [Glycine max]|nr:hypothetical protein JHK82_048035 [Glycine max]